jgi:hypothetical protein
MAFLVSHFRKYVPTDMNWSGNFEGYYAEVRLHCLIDSKGTHYNVIVRGTDDTSVNRWFDDLDEALALYNSVQYLQGPADLAGFDPSLPGTDCNGWPHPCPPSGLRGEDRVWAPRFNFQPQVPRLFSGEQRA